MDDIIERIRDKDEKRGIKSENLFKRAKGQENGRLNSRKTSSKKAEPMTIMAKLLKGST